MRDWNGFMGGLVFGVVLGGVLAMLYAPERGDRTRKRLAKRGGKWLDGATDQAGDLVDRSRKKMGI